MPDETTVPTDSLGETQTEIPSAQAGDDRDDAEPVDAVDQTPTDLGAAK